MELRHSLDACVQSWRDDAATLRTGTDRLLSCCDGESDADFLLGATVIALVARFQRGCLDVVTVAAGALRRAVDSGIGPILEQALLLDLRIARGNATVGALQADLRRFGVDFVESLLRFGPRESPLRGELEMTHTIRNAIAHGDADPTTPVTLAHLNRIFTALDAVLDAISTALREHLFPLTTADREV